MALFVLADRDGRRPTLSRGDDFASSSVMMGRVREPSMTSWANLMPSTKLSFWLMRAATSSVLLLCPNSWP